MDMPSYNSFKLSWYAGRDGYSRWEIESDALSCIQCLVCKDDISSIAHGTAWDETDMRNPICKSGALLDESVKLQRRQQNKLPHGRREESKTSLQNFLLPIEETILDNVSLTDRRRPINKQFFSPLKIYMHFTLVTSKIWMNEELYIDHQAMPYTCSGQEQLMECCIRPKLDFWRVHWSTRRTWARSSCM